jgi:hypothetical protein
MPMTTSGSPKEPKNEQQAAGHNQSSPFAFRKRLHGDPDKVIAFAMVCWCASCDNSSGAVEGPQHQPLGARALREGPGGGVRAPWGLAYFTIRFSKNIRPPVSPAELAQLYSFSPLGETTVAARALRQL